MSSVNAIEHSFPRPDRALFADYLTLMPETLSSLPTEGWSSCAVHIALLLGVS